MFFRSCLCCFGQYIANITQRTFKIIKESRSGEYNNLKLIISIIKNVKHTSTCEVLRDVSIKLQLSLCAIMAS